MKRLLRSLAVVLVAGALLAWFATGMNRGWTETNIPKKTFDDVTGIEGVTFQKGFIPGIDFLGAAALGAVVLTGISFLFSSKPVKPTTKT